jgi:hypothetical protein
MTRRRSVPSVRSISYFRLCCSAEPHSPRSWQRGGSYSLLTPNSACLEPSTRSSAAMFPADAGKPTLAVGRKDPMPFVSSQPFWGGSSLTSVQDFWRRVLGSAKATMPTSAFVFGSCSYSPTTVSVSEPTLTVPRWPVGPPRAPQLGRPGRRGRRPPGSGRCCPGRWCPGFRTPGASRVAECPVG